MKNISLDQILSKDQINEKVKELGDVISKDYKNLSPVLIGVLNGAFIFLGDLIRSMRIIHKVDFITISSYVNGSNGFDDISLIKDISTDIHKREVIIVEDIVDTGKSLSYLKKHIAKYNPTDIKTCALIDKKERREINISADYTGFEIDEGFLIGYGMDYKGLGRNIHGIYSLRNIRTGSKGD